MSYRLNYKMITLKSNTEFLEWWYCTVRKKEIPTDWVIIDENDNETYPPEGYSVQIIDKDDITFPMSDNISCSWLASSEYVWCWENIVTDENGIFGDTFRPVKWRFV